MSRLLVLQPEREYDMANMDALARLSRGLPDVRLVLVRRRLRWTRWDRDELSRQVEDVLFVDPCAPGATEAILGELRGRDVGGVLAINEDCLRTAAAVAAARSLPVPRPSVIEVARDKQRLREVLAAAGVRVPAARAVHSAGEALETARTLGFPVVIKPTDKAGSVGVIRVDRESDLDRAYRLADDSRWGDSRDGAVLVEPYVTGTTATLNAIVYRGELRPLCASIKKTTGAPFFLTHEDTMPATGELTAVVTQAVRRATIAMGLDHGFVHAELVVPDQGEPYILEITPRPGGGFVVPMIEAHCGVDAIVAAAELALGREPRREPKPGPATVGRYVRADRAGVLVDLRPAPTRPGVPMARWVKRRGDLVALPPADYFTELGFVVAVGSTVAAARAELDAFLGGTRVSIEACGPLRRGAILTHRLLREPHLIRRAYSGATAWIRPR